MIYTDRYVIPYSGGVESMALLAWTKVYNNTLFGRPPVILPLVFNDNRTEFRNREPAIIAGLIKMGLYRVTNTLTMPDNDKLEQQNGMIPGYKMTMVTTALSYAASQAAGHVAFGHCNENHHQPYPDQTKKFFDDVAALWHKYYKDAESLDQIKVVNPFIGMTKAEVIRAYHIRVPLELSVSCDSLVLTGTDHCGECQGCHDRAIAFDLAGVDDPTHYRKPPISD